MLPLPVSPTPKAISPRKPFSGFILEPYTCLNPQAPPGVEHLCNRGSTHQHHAPQPTPRAPPGDRAGHIRGWNAGKRNKIG